MKGYSFSVCNNHKRNLGNSDNYLFLTLLQEYIDHYYYDFDLEYRVFGT